MRGSQPFQKNLRDGNEYTAVMTDHLEDRAICGKEALSVGNGVVQEWILKHSPYLTP